VLAKTGQEVFQLANIIFRAASVSLLIHPRTLVFIIFVFVFSS